MNWSFAACAFCRFSGDSAPGMYWVMYAVAKNRRAFGFLGSNSTAVLKCSTDSEYLAFLKEATPLFISSRDLRKLQPEENETNAPRAVNAIHVLFIDYC